MSTSASLGAASKHTIALPEPIADATQEPPYPIETRPRRRRWISVVGDLIFAALCMMIAAFFILVLGVFGALLYLTSRAGALIGRLALGHRTTAWISRNRPLGTRFEPHARTIAVFVRRA